MWVEKSEEEYQKDNQRRQICALDRTRLGKCEMSGAMQNLRTVGSFMVDGVRP